MVFDDRLLTATGRCYSMFLEPPCAREGKSGCNRIAFETGHQFVLSMNGLLVRQDLKCRYFAGSSVSDFRWFIIHRFTPAHCSNNAVNSRFIVRSIGCAWRINLQIDLQFVQQRQSHHNALRFGSSSNIC